ncbi:unnamed protein product, partial [Adineta steineri]
TAPNVQYAPHGHHHVQPTHYNDFLSAGQHYADSYRHEFRFLKLAPPTKPKRSASRQLGQSH